MANIRWAHFSDLHFKYDNYPTIEMRRSLEKYIAEKCNDNHFVIITGDVCHKGEYDSETVDFVKRLINNAGCPMENVVITPGNHDAKRSEPRKMCLESIIRKYYKNNALKIPEDFRSALIAEPFAVFRKLYEEIKGVQPLPQLHYIVNSDNIRFIVLNTSVFSGQTYPGQEYSSDDEEKRESQKENNNLFICDEELSSLTSGDSPDILNVVVAHHAVECFNATEKALFLNKLDSLNADLYLCGHVHETLLDTLNKTRLGQQQVTCGGLFVDDYNMPSFVTGEFNPGSGAVILTIHAYIQKNDNWAVSNDAPKPYDGGVCEYYPKRLKKNLPSKRELTPPIPMPTSMTPMFSQNVMFIYKSAVQQRQNTPFRDNRERLTEQYPSLEQKHILLLDKMFITFAEKDSRVCAVADCLPTAPMTVSHPCYQAFLTDLYDRVLKDAGEEWNGFVLSERLENIILLVIEKYHALICLMTDFLLPSATGPNIRGFFPMIKKTITRPSEKFAGYGTELIRLKDTLSKPGYLYIHGGQGYGKTMLIAKMLYDVCFAAELSQNSIKAEAPWLPHCFAVFGKHVADMAKALELLIGQANLLLSEPINHEVNISREYFESILNILCKELPHVTIVFDALDEMGMSNLAIFPGELPANCTIILTGKEKLRDISQHMQHIPNFSLKGFGRKEICALLGVQEKDKKYTQYISFIKDITKGNPYHLTEIAKDFIANGRLVPKDFMAATVGLKGLFEKNREKWKETGSSDCPLYRILELLVIFEPVGYLSLEQIQSYLAYCKIEMKSERIAESLETVRHQLDTDGSGRFKLMYNAFALHVLEKYSMQDFRMTFGGIVKWIGECPDTADMVADIFIRWHIYSEESNQLSFDLLDILAANQNMDGLKRIVTIYTSMCENDILKKRVQKALNKCFSVISETDGDVLMPRFNYFYNIIATDESRAQALTYLHKLADQGNQEAISKYADLLLYGSLYVKQDAVMAEKYYNMLTDSEKKHRELHNMFLYTNASNKMKSNIGAWLSTGSQYAQVAYAEQLAYGDLYAQDLERSQAILDELILNNNYWAMHIKACLISGNILPDCSMQDALQLWDEAGKHVANSLYRKGLYIFENAKSPLDKKKGLRLIERAGIYGISAAAVFLAEYDIENKKAISKSRAAKLRNAVNKGSRAAAIQLIECIDNGRINPTDANELIRLREFLLQDKFSGFDKNLSRLAFYYYDRRQYADAYAVFERVYENGDDIAAINMAYLLRREPSLSDRYNAEILLKPSVDAYDSLAVINYVLLVLSRTEDADKWEEMIAMLKALDMQAAHGKDALKWWSELAVNGDAEGDMVLGLLLLSGKLETDPQGKTMNERFAAARKCGFVIPEDAIRTHFQ